MTATAPSPDTRTMLRLAEPRDNAARCELFARVSMEAELAIAVHRGPDFDALYRLQSSDWLGVVVEMDGRVEGTGVVLVRDGYLNGRPARVGYLGDLRFSPNAQGRFVLDREFGPLLESARERYGCELFLTSVIASNSRAMRALAVTTRRSGASGRPVYTPLGDFDIRSIHLLLPRRSRPHPVRVRRATDADLGAIAALLDADARSRPFGYVFTEAELRRRIAAWPGLRVESFHVAETRRGIVGCLALWDASPVKRMVVQEYGGRMRRVRAAHDLGAALLRRPRLPAPGEAFRYQYVTHQAIVNDDPAVLRALLEHAYADARRTGCHFLSLCAPVDDALDAASRAFHCTNLRARLFVVALPGVDVSAATGGARWPGFEMALV